MHELSFPRLRQASMARCAAVFGGLSRWSVAEWAVARAGECGEACNLVKKLRRLETNPEWNAPDDQRESVLKSRIADEPLRTITPRAGGGFAVIAPHITKFFGGVVGQAAEMPLPTVTAIDHNGIVAATLVQYNQEKGNETRGKAVTDPINVVTPANRFAVSAAFLSKHQGDRPDGTVHTGAAVDQPLPTITGRGTQTMLGVAALTQFNGKSVGQSVESPAPTQLSERKTGLVSASIVRLGQHGGNGHYSCSVDDPLTTITSKAEHCVSAAALIHMNHGEKQWSEAGAPLRTILAGGNHHGLVRAFLLKYFGTCRNGQPCGDPLHTITANDRFGLVQVEGEDYAIVDIGLRMLSPRELFRRQGFPETYIITPEFRGKPLSKAMQVKMCGNSVSPFPAEALVRVNFPEECVPRVEPSRSKKRKAAAS